MGRTLRLLLYSVLSAQSSVLYGQLQQTGQFFVTDCANLTAPVANSTFCVQTTNASGRVAGHQYRRNNSSGWDDITAGSGLTFAPAGNISSTNLQAAIQELDTEKLATGANAVTASALAATPTLCATGQAPTGVLANGNATGCASIASAVVDQSANYTWTGTHSWRSNNWSLLDSTTPTKILKWDISGFTAATTRTMTLPNASTRLLGDSDFGSTGWMTRTGAGTYVNRTFGTQPGEITITNPDGVAGAPSFGLGTLALKTNQSNTFTTGDQSFLAAASLTVPTTAGYTTTNDGRIGFNSTTKRYVGSSNSAAVNFAYTSEIQPLNANLTALSGLTGAANTFFYFSSVGAMSTSVMPSCTDSAGQHLNWNGNWVCGTSSTGGLSGMTTGKIQKALSASTIGDSVISESGGNISMTGGLTVGSGPYYLPATGGLTADRTYTVQDQSGLLVPALTTPTITDGHIVIFGVTAGVVTFKDGGAAGAGTWTDSSTSTGTNKTIDAEATGNVITIPVYIVLAAGGCNNTTASAGFDLPTANAPTPSCFGTTTTQGTLTFADGSTQTATNHLRLPTDWTGNVDVDLIWFANAASANAVRWSVATGCVADSEAINTGPSYNTASASNTAYTGTANQRKTTNFTTVAVTNCSAGETLYLQVQRIGADAGDTLTASAELLEVGLKIRRAM